MPTANFHDVHRRLVMRYENASTFNFAKIRVNSSNQTIYDLARAFSSIQSVQPKRITAVVTQQLVL